jgi:hypothetical protein
MANIKDTSMSAKTVNRESFMSYGAKTSSNANSLMKLTAPVTREELAHLQQLVRDLVQGDANLPSGKSDADSFDQTPYIIKQIFQSEREEAFSEQLSIFVARKENEIEKVCGLVPLLDASTTRNLCNQLTSCSKSGPGQHQ